MSFPYAAFERAFLRLTCTLTASDLFPQQNTSKVKHQLATAKGELATIENKLKQINKAIVESPELSSSIFSALKTLEHHRKTASKEVDRFKNLAASETDAKLSDTQGIAETLQGLTGDKLLEARLRLRSLIGGLVERIEVSVCKMDGDLILAAGIKFQSGIVRILHVSRTITFFRTGKLPERNITFAAYAGCSTTIIFPL